MKILEFNAQVSEEHTLKIPPELVEQVDAHQVAGVILFIRDGDKARQSPGEKAAALTATFGSCKEDESLVGIFRDIDRERHAKHISFSYYYRALPTYPFRLLGKSE